MNTERTGQHLWTDNNPQKLILPPHWNCYHTAPGQAPLPSLTGGWDKGGEKWWLALKRNSAKWTKRQSSDIEAHIGGCSTLSWRAHLIQHVFLARTSNSASNRAGHTSPFVFVFCEYVFQCICALCSVLNQAGHISPPPPQLSVLPPLLPLSQAIILCSAKSTKLTPTKL